MNVAQASSLHRDLNESVEHTRLPTQFIAKTDLGQFCQLFYNQHSLLNQSPIRTPMTILDRYLITLFVKIFAVCFLSFSGLYVVIDVFTKLDELARLVESGHQWVTLLGEIYGPRVVDIFDKTSAMMALFAAIFALTLMQRRREVTAIVAAGLPMRRVVRPILAVSLVIIAVAAVNREWLLPQMRDSLVRTPQSWSGQKDLPMTVQDDLTTGVRLRGHHLALSTSTVYSPDVQLPVELAPGVTRIRAATAVLMPATDQHPAGLFLDKVGYPKEIYQINSIVGDVENDSDAPFAVLTPVEHDWLYGGQCFVVCNFDAQQIAYGSKLKEFQTVPEMMAEVRKPQPVFGRSRRLDLHSRILKPILDLTLILLGLPLVISQRGRNVFASAGICLLIVGGFHVAVMLCQSLGNYSLVRPAALAAWLPMMIFFPFAVLSMRNLNR